MSKVIEKKQVCGWSGCLSIQLAWLIATSTGDRCRTLCECIQVSWRGVSIHVAMTLQARHYLQKRSASLMSFTRTPKAPLTRSVQEQCMLNCADKFLKHSERVGARFAEQNAGECADWQVLVSKLTIFHRGHERFTKINSHLVKPLDPVSYLCVIPSLPV